MDGLDMLQASLEDDKKMFREARDKVMAVFGEMNLTVYDALRVLDWMHTNLEFEVKKARVSNLFPGESAEEKTEKE